MCSKYHDCIITKNQRDGCDPLSFNNLLRRPNALLIRPITKNTDVNQNLKRIY